MQILESAFVQNEQAAQRILAVKIGISDDDVNTALEKIAVLIHAELSAKLLPEVEAKLREKLPELVEKVGPDITIAGLKQLIKS